MLLVGAGGDPSYLQPGFVRKRSRSEPGIEAPTGIHLWLVSHAEAEAFGVRFVKEWRPDVIHLHVFWLWPLARTICARTGIRLVYTVHSLDRAEYEVGQGPPECLSQWETQVDLITSADLIVALTRNERELLTEYCPLMRDRIRVVGNGIEDSAAARAAALRRRDNDAPLILFTGRFVERKGVRELLSAAALVLKSMPSTRFVLAGGHRHCDGASMARYWMPPELVPHRERVHFTGWLSAEELAFWYWKSDVLTVPSWYEPFGMVVLEGML